MKRVVKIIFKILIPGLILVGVYFLLNRFFREDAIILLLFPAISLVIIYKIPKAKLFVEKEKGFLSIASIFAILVAILAYSFNSNVEINSKAAIIKAANQYNTGIANMILNPENKGKIHFNKFSTDIYLKSFDIIQIFSIEDCYFDWLTVIAKMEAANTVIDFSNEVYNLKSNAWNTNQEKNANMWLEKYDEEQTVIASEVKTLFDNIFEENCTIPDENL